MKEAIIPIFPLNLVCFPDEQLNLHIFEPRYKQLITESEAKGTNFGIPTYIKDRELIWGTEVSLDSIAKKYPDGKMDIKVSGKGIFKIENVIHTLNGRLYSGADVTLQENDRKVDFDKNKIILKMMRTLYKYLKLQNPLPEDPYSFDCYTIGHFVGLSVEKELKLLSILSEEKRQDYILKHLKKIIPIIKEMNALEKKIKMNGHFKNLIPPNI